MSLFKTVFFAIFGLFVAVQFGCSPDHSSETPEVGKVTFIFYGQADQGIATSLANRFFDLHQNCTKDYRALSMLNFPEAFRPLMAQGFGVEKIGTLIVASNGLSDKTVIVENSIDRTIDMSNPATLTRLIDLAAKTFPAEQYVILFSGHGTGWRFDDDGTRSAAGGDKTLPGITLAAATKALDNCSIKGKIKLIHFESCLMMGHEYITALAPYAPYIMGTATASWGVQHLIDQLVTLIQQNDNWETVCQKYVAYGMTHPQLKNTYWMVPMAVRTAEVAALLPTIKTMNNAIISYCNLGEAERLQVRELFIFKTHLYDDIYSLADLNDFYFRLTLLNPVFAQPYGAYKSALDRFVLAAGDTNGTERKSEQQRASGNTTYSPSILCPGNNEEYQKLKKSRYNELLFVRETLTDQLYSVLYR